MRETENGHPDIFFEAEVVDEELETGGKYLTPAEIIRGDSLLQEALGFDPQFRVGLRVSVFNAEMRIRREEAGLSQKELSLKLQEKGVSQGLQTAGQIERFQRFPNEKLAEAIADELGTTPEVLFPNWLRFCLIKRGKSTIVLERPVSPQEIKQLQAQATSKELALPAPRVVDPEVIVDKMELRELFDKFIADLSPKEAELIRMRYYEDLTLKKIAEALNLNSIEVVRKRIFAVLRKLRHPKYSRHLGLFWE